MCAQGGDERKLELRFVVVVVVVFVKHSLTTIAIADAIAVLFLHPATTYNTSDFGKAAG